MRVLYVANHGGHGNDEEGSIASALRAHGCDVVCTPEHRPEASPCDLVLFHKFAGWDFLRRVEAPKAFWYFDLVRSYAPELRRRDSLRIHWMDEAQRIVDFGFCTDGDWAVERGLRWLPQAAQPYLAEQDPAAKPILIAASLQGVFRRQFVQRFKTQHGSAVEHLERGWHGARLAQLMRSAQFCVAPSWPCTDRYWSNRAYLTCGYGGLLVHPRSEGLAKHYKPNEEALYYSSWKELEQLLAAGPRPEVAEAGYLRTCSEHTYVHRVGQLLGVVRERTDIRS